MKTILMICPFAKPNIGGVESHLEKLTGYISKNGNKVILLTYQPLTTNAKGAKYEKRGGIEVYRVSWFGTGWFPKLEPHFPLVFLYLFPGLFLKSLIVGLRRRKEIDVVHAHGFVAAAITRILVRIINKPCVVSTHAIYNLQNRALLASLVKFMLKGFDTILAVGEPSKKELIDIGLDENKIKVYHNWIDTNVFNPLDRDECRKALDLNPADFVVLYLGRFLEMKGLLVLLDAARKTDNKSIKFIFVGDGPLSETIQDTAKTNDNVKYYGRLSDEDIIKAYNAADIYAAPVLYEEGFATVYLESLSCGTPVITAKRGCLPYFLTSEVADLLEAIDTETVLKVLNYYLNNWDVLDKKRVVCRKYAEEHFSEKNAEAILNSY